MSCRVGILGYQGCIEPHEAIFAKLGVTTMRVRSPDELCQVDRLIIPGGESTTMLHFITRFGMKRAIQDFALRCPVWGICAGAILAAREVHNPAQESLSLIDISAHRNFYGSQAQSFAAALELQGIASPVEAEFIRAPRLAPLEATRGRPAAEVLGSLAGQPVFLAQGHVWACSFHVELCGSTALHERFLALPPEAARRTGHAAAI